MHLTSVNKRCPRWKIVKTIISAIYSPPVANVSVAVVIVGCDKSWTYKHPELKLMIKIIFRSKFHTVFNMTKHKGFSSSPPRENGCHVTDDIFKCIFMNEKYCILFFDSKFVPNGPIDKKSALVQVMAWHRTGDKPLSEPMLTQFTDAYMWD